MQNNGHVCAGNYVGVVAAAADRSCLLVKHFLKWHFGRSHLHLHVSSGINKNRCYLAVTLLRESRCCYSTLSTSLSLSLVFLLCLQVHHFLCLFIVPSAVIFACFIFSHINRTMRIS